PVARERAQRPVGDETQAVEAAVDVLADRVVPTGEHEVELAGPEHCDGEGYRAQARGAGRAGRHSTAIEPQARACVAQGGGGEERAENAWVVLSEIDAPAAHAVERGAQDDSATSGWIGEMAGRVGFAHGLEDGVTEVPRFARE